MPKQVELTPEAREVLTRATIEPLWVFLPTGKLEPAVYKAVDNFLKALGGKWNRSQQGHKFERGTAEVAAAIAAGKATDTKKTFEQFFTPPDVADQVVRLAQIEGTMRVLEPSAGGGALIAAIAKAHSAAIIHAIEIDPRLVGELRNKFMLRATIAEGDFLRVDWREAFERIVMNPPFGRGADMAHVTKALSVLKPGGILVAIMSPHWTFASDGPAERFRGLVNEHSHDWTPLPEGSFKSAGTGVSTGILTIRKGNI